MSNPWDANVDPVETFFRDLEENGLENTFAKRYYAKYEAVVVSNQDPQSQGRIRVRVYALGRKDHLDLWAYPSAVFAGQDYGMYFPPEIGDMVWIWFDHGNPMHPGASGGWWVCPKKTSESSYVPHEFKEIDTLISPSKRGIKTKQGHGLLFDDTALSPKVELWSGKQSTPGSSALKKNLITLSDAPGQERLSLETLVGHALRLIDNPVGTNGVVLETLAGLRLFFDETLQLVRIETPAGREVLIDDLDATLSLSTPTGLIEIDDASQTMDITSVGQVSVTGLGVNINSTSGLQKQEGVAGLEQSFTTKVVKINGPETHDVLGTYQQQITGASTLTFLGGLIMAITGTAIIGGVLSTAASLAVGIAAPAAVTLGSITGVFFRLVTEAFIGQYNANVAIHNANVAIFNAHAHPFFGNLGAPGVTAPTLIPQVPVSVVSPDSVTTVTTVAN